MPTVDQLSDSPCAKSRTLFRASFPTRRTTLKRKTCMRESLGLCLTFVFILSVATCPSVNADEVLVDQAARVKQIEATGVQPTSWPRFRGPLADGVALDHELLPSSWSKQDNVLWSIDVSRLGMVLPGCLGGSRLHHDGGDRCRVCEAASRFVLGTGGQNTSPGNTSLAGLLL